MSQPNWTKYFDRIFLVNLKYRKDRLKASLEELKKYNINFERFEATFNADGALGLHETMMELFLYSRNKGYKRILVFEDDIRFIEDPNPVMNKVVEQMPDSWDLLYLGCNHTKPFSEKYSENLLPVKTAYSSHCVGYSQFAMKCLLSQPRVIPFDVALVDTIQSVNNSYCTFPMLCTQVGGFSDIEKKIVKHYPNLLENRFAEQTKNLI